MGFQIAWSESTPGEKHASFSGHKTACGLSVIEAEPVYASKAEHVTCWLCGGALTFDVETAQKKAVEFVRAYPGAKKWSNEGVYEFAHGVADRVAGVAWHVKREHRSWNQNHVLSEFMAQGGYMTDDGPVARMIGLTALAVLEVLTEIN